MSAVRARAFGLDLEAGFELPGIEGGERVGPDRPLRLRTVAPEDLPCAAGAERIAEVAAPGGAAATVDSLGEAGYLLWAEGFGRAWVAADGGEVSCAPADLPAWRWQRFLVGQVLPFASVLRGLEAFHASAVVVGGRALAVVAGSGAGKTSLGLELALRGLPLLNDDVLVVEGDDCGGVVAHPGAGLANVRASAAGLAERVERAGLGRPLGAAGGEVRMAVGVHDRPVPLGFVFYLRRTAEGSSAAIERMAPVDPRLLLASTFNLSLLQPERLARQLDVCGRIARSCAVLRVDCPPAVDARALAERMHAAALASPEPVRS